MLKSKGYCQTVFYFSLREGRDERSDSFIFAFIHLSAVFREKLKLNNSFKILHVLFSKLHERECNFLLYGNRIQ